MQLNEQQLAAVNEPPKNITVSAAAGSGKTQVLGARVLGRITGPDPVDVNRLLIVTFTRAAAAEMRARISRSVSDAIKNESDPAARRNLERQLSLLGGADICTIDSFCYRILKQNFFRVPGLSADFSVDSENSLRDLTGEALREVVEMFSAALEESRGGELTAPFKKQAARLRELVPPEDIDVMLEGFARLSENYGSLKKTNDFVTDDGGYGKKADYVDFIRDIKRMTATVAEPEKWLRELETDYDASVPFDDTRLGRFAADWAASVLKDVTFRMDAEMADGGLSAKNTNTYTGTLEGLRKIRPPETYSQAAEMLNGGFPKKGRAFNDDENGHTVITECKKMWDDTAARFVSPERIEAFRKKMYPIVKALCAMTRLTLSLETEKMLEKKRLSFSACVSLTLGLLTDGEGNPSETALELRDYYDEIYVDEAQDIDPRQLALFEAISNGRLFMVGDVKQSIYGFRSAEPEIFNSRCFSGGDSRLITMNMNYRSSRTVISAVNQVFGRVMTRGVMNIDYQNGHSMSHGEEWLPEPTRAEFLAVVGGEDSEGEDGNNGKKRGRKGKSEGEAGGRELENMAVANRIIQLIDSGRQVYDKDTGTLRPVEYRDILVLHRSNNDGVELERALSDAGIPCFLDGGEGLYSKEETSAVIDVLRLLDNPNRDFPLAATLRGLMFGFGENDLLKIRAVSRRTPFASVFAALGEPSDPRHGDFAERLGDGALLDRCLEVGALLKKWRTAAAFRPVSEVIGLILTDTGYYASVGALPSGAGRRANLELLMDAAADFESGGSRGLYAFIDYVDRRELSGGATDFEAKTLSDAMNVVRLMTIHKSKGLEAPVVILTRCAAPITAKSSASVISRNLGFSADYIDEEAGLRYVSPLTGLISLESGFRARAEEVRLLYVAMTRPRELLICTGCFSNAAAAEKAWRHNRPFTGSEIALLPTGYARLIGASVKDSRIWNYVEVPASEVRPAMASDRLRSAPAFEEDVPEAVAGLLGFTYSPFVSDLPAKVSVSALKAYGEDDAHRAFPAPPRKPRVPSFVWGDGEEPVTGASLGTAYHAVMENIDFSLPVTPQIDALEQRGIISPAERKLIMDRRIATLLDGPLGQRMRSARRLWREAPFMINVPANEIDGLNAPEGETVAVQGVIDCFFEDADGITLVDYKTDSYTDPEEIVSRYRKQLDYYARAIKMKFPDKKIQKYLYLFHKSDIIEVV